MYTMLAVEAVKGNFGLWFKIVPMKFHLLRWPVLFVVLTLASCLKTDDTFEDLPTTASVSKLSGKTSWYWTELYLQIERDLRGFRPAPTCRALAYIHMGAYELAQPGMPGYASLEQQIPGWDAPSLRYIPSQIDWNIALNAYYARTAKFFLFGASADDHFRIDALEATELSTLSLGVPQGIVNTSIEWGQDMANAIIAYSETDREGADQIRVPRPSDYTPPSGAGLWIPTAVDQGRALFPYWGRVRTFANSGDDLVALPPYSTYADYSTDPSSEYYQQNLEVANAVANLDYESEWIAEFWSDDLEEMTFSPPARIFAIANQVINNDQLPLDRTLHLNCVLGLALNDASVAAWNSKYLYNTERPETYIITYIDPNFRSALGRAIGQPGINPSFPGYPSGHSTFAGVGWEVFEHFFGANYDFTDNCHFGRSEFRGEPRSFRTWREMAEENAYSRIPLGVHVRMDCDEGLRLGRSVAANVLELELRLPQ